LAVLHIVQQEKPKDLSAPLRIWKFDDTVISVSDILLPRLFFGGILIKDPLDSLVYHS
jgi:hypothetical protein